MEKNENKSIFEKLIEINPDAEIWWDSSPLIYPLWRDELLGPLKDSNEREKIKERLLRLYNPDISRRRPFPRSNYQPTTLT